MKNRFKNKPKRNKQIDMRDREKAQGVAKNKANVSPRQPK